MHSHQDYLTHIEGDTLDLRHQNLNDDDMPAIMAFLERRTQITVLSLDFNKLGPLSAKMFAQQNKTITSVSFAGNVMGNEGLAYFCQKNKLVKQVSFSCANISKLDDFVKWNTVVEVADFSWNINLRDSGIKALIKDTILSKVYLSNFDITQAKIKEIEQRLNARKYLRPVNKDKHIDYSQVEILRKINLYLISKNRHQLDPGYCNGISLLWVYKMAEKKEQWFYNTVLRIVHCPAQCLHEIEDDIEKFLSYIEWAQNTEIVMEKESHLQRSMALILEVEKVKQLTKTCDKIELKKIFDRYTQDGSMIRLAANLHAIAVFKRDLDFYCFDSNYPTGRATIFPVSSFDDFFNEINRCLRVNVPNVELETISNLEIDIARHRSIVTRLFKRKVDAEFEKVANPKPAKIMVVPSL